MNIWEAIAELEKGKRIVYRWDAFEYSEYERKDIHIILNMLKKRIVSEKEGWEIVKETGLEPTRAQDK